MTLRDSFTPSNLLMSEGLKTINFKESVNKLEIITISREITQKISEKMERSLGRSKLKNIAI